MAPKFELQVDDNKMMKTNLNGQFSNKINIFTKNMGSYYPACVCLHLHCNCISKIPFLTEGEISVIVVKIDYGIGSHFSTV